METFDLYCEKLAVAASAYSFGAKEPDRFFEAMETVLDTCVRIKEDFPDKEYELSKKLDYPSEPVRRIFAFCLLEYFDCSEKIELAAMKTISEFLDGSYGAQHIVWLAWFEAWEKRKNKKSEYVLRAELSPLTENYAEQWLKIAREQQKKKDVETEFVSETPIYPFDSFDLLPDDDKDSDEDEFPY